MNRIMPASSRSAGPKPCVLLMSHEPLSKRMSGYAQAIHTLGVGLSAKGIDCHVMTPYVTEDYSRNQENNSGSAFAVDIPGREPNPCSLLHHVEDGVSYLELVHGRGDNYFAFPNLPSWVIETTLSLQPICRSSTLVEN